MKKLLFLFLVFILVLLAGCATLPHGRYETELNIHDVFFAVEEPTDYDECEKWDTTSFKYGDEPCIVVRFGGLQPDEYNDVQYAAAVVISYNGTPTWNMGPAYFRENLDKIERDKYMIKIPLEMVDTIQPGLYGFKILIADGVVHAVVETHIEFSLLPREINCMQLWDEMMGYPDDDPF